MPEEIVLPGTPTPDGNDEPPLEQFITEQTEKAAMDEANKTLYQRAKNSEGTIKELRELAGVKSVTELKAKLSSKPETPSAPTAPIVKADENEIYVELRQQGYTREEIEVARRIGGGKPLSEAIQDTIAQAAISGLRAKRQVEQATPEPSSRAPIYGDKPFSALAPQEKSKNYSQVIEAGIKKARSQSRTLI